MDLADIRKKARTRNATLPAGDLADDVLLAVIPESRHDVVNPAADSPFLSEIGTEQFITEDEYAQGLTSIESDDGERVQWLGFFLGQEEYALDIEVISELIKPRALTELPQVPQYVCGIITLRGEVIPVVDLKTRLGLKTENQSSLDLQRIIICEGEEQRVGLMVDRISQVVHLPLDEIENPHLVDEKSSTAFILGIGRVQGRMLIQLSPEKIMEIEGAGNSKAHLPISDN